MFSSTALVVKCDKSKNDSDKHAQTCNGDTYYFSFFEARFCGWLGGALLAGDIAIGCG